MIDKQGLNDACYVPLALPGAEAIDVGLKVSFETGFAPTPPEDIRKRNPQLVRKQGSTTWMYHPSFSVGEDGRHNILFDRWVPWSDADACKIVLRADTRRSPKLLLARPDEKKVFTFDDPEDGRLKYINLDFLTNREDFPAVFIRIGPRAANRFIRISAELSKGTPVVTATVVQSGQVPSQLAR